MLNYISAKEAAKKWNISQRRVSVLCSENRINGAAMLGKMWIIPIDANKPEDMRSVRYHDNKTESAKPFVKWVGGKSQLIDQIEKELLDRKGRTFRKYAEPMVGGGALLFNVLSRYDFEELYISDINPELINAYRSVKSDVNNLITMLEKMQKQFLQADEVGRKQIYYAIREEFNQNALSKEGSTKKAAQFIFLNKTCFNGLYRVNRKGQFNVPMGSYKNPVICDCKNLRNANTALQNVTIICGDYSLAKTFIDKDTFVYFDPPYRPISETSSFTSYNADVFDDDEQIRLSKFINEINLTGAKIVLSNSDPKNLDENDNFFDDLYENYKIDRIGATRAINSKGDKRGRINELLITN